MRFVTSEVGSVLFLGISSLSLVRKPAMASTAEADHDYQRYTCTFDLSGVARPILTEREILHFRHCVIAVTAVHVNAEAIFDYIVMTEQTWAVGESGSVRGRRHLGNGQSKVETRAQCRKCSLDTLSTRALLELSEQPSHPAGAQQEEGRDRRSLASDFESGLFYCLTDETLYPGYPNEMDFSAFAGLDSVKSSCSIEVDSDAHVNGMIADVANATNVTEKICTTTIDNACAPILTEPEMVHFDKCWIDSWNVYHSNNPLDNEAMIGNEVLDQKPLGGILQQPENRRGRRLATGKNEVVSRATMRRLSESNDDFTIRRRASLLDAVAAAVAEEGGEDDDFDNDDYEKREQEEDGRLRRLIGNITAESLLDYDSFLCECLKHGHENGTLYDAFAGDILCETHCAQPIVTDSEFEALQQAQREKHSEAVLEWQSEFNATISEEESILTEELAMIQAKIDKLKNKEQEFQAELENVDQRFVAYQEKEAQSFHQMNKRYCANVTAKMNCDGVYVLHPLQGLRDNGGYVDLRLHQNFNMNLNGNCLHTTASGADSASFDFLFRYDHWGDYQTSTCRRATDVGCGSFLDLEARCVGSGPRWTDIQIMIKKEYLPNSYVVDKTMGTMMQPTNTYGGYKGRYVNPDYFSYMGSSVPLWGQDTWGGDKSSYNGVYGYPDGMNGGGGGRSLYTVDWGYWGYTAPSATFWNPATFSTSTTTTTAHATFWNPATFSMSTTTSTYTSTSQPASVIGKLSSDCEFAAEAAKQGRHYCYLEFRVDCDCVGDMMTI